MNIILNILISIMIVICIAKIWFEIEYGGV
jgi:hypothetical protein